MEELQNQLHPDPGDDHVRAVHDRRVAADQREHLPDEKPHRHDPEKPAREDDP